MDREKTKIEKRYVCNTNLAKTEKWLRDQSKRGWKLTQVKSGAVRTAFTFTKAVPCDRLYFARAHFYKQPNLECTAQGVFNYIKSTYGGKPLQGTNYDGWYYIKRSDDTDLEDIRKNLQYREKCIQKEGLLFFISFFVCLISLLVINFLSAKVIRIDALVVLSGLLTLFYGAKLIYHHIGCKKAYADFKKV